MLRVYHRVKVNTALLDLENYTPKDLSSPFADFLKNHTRTTLPAGNVVGVTFNDYSQTTPVIANLPPSGGNQLFSPQIMPLWSQTDIRMLDSQNREITTETDISDYRHKSGGHVDGFKNIDMKNDADAVIRIEWETIGKKPICGEFVFIIEQEDCECS
ncbi:hypothetical protein [Tenacibaculum sp. nBUS_03]|uniref:hypothetical protein n=1 Tax=Tenacibaculum sp. nBUS_03 TaxID=3395320 RepID=UPI003EBDCE42